MFFMSLGLIAQNVNIEGSVKDATGQPLPGVNIIVKGTTQGTSTDFDGNFTLNDVSINSVIVVSYLGFTTKEITVVNADRLGHRIRRGC